MGPEWGEGSGGVSGGGQTWHYHLEGHLKRFLITQKAMGDSAERF